jgi:hypothetical protein
MMTGSRRERCGRGLKLFAKIEIRQADAHA